MEKFRNPIYLLLSVVVFFASCIDSDDNEFVLYDDAAITSFNLTSAKILNHTTSSKGEDSTYYSSTTVVVGYPFTIDHVKREIFNQDSLPYGIDATRLLCEYATVNNGMVGIENEVGDTVAYLQTTDTIDFSKPRYLRVYSSDNSTSRRYKVTVNVHQEKADSFQWKRMADETAFASMKSMRMLVLGGKVIMLGTDGSKTVVYANEAGAWNEMATLGAEASANAVVKGDTLFVKDGTMLKWSLDAFNFTDVAEANDIVKLVGACKTELYAYATDGMMMVSKDGGKIWSADELDSDASYLPQQDVDYDCSAFNYNADTDYMLLIGNRSLDGYPEEATAMVWRKIIEYAPYSKKYRWSYIDFAESSYYPLPRLAGLQVVNYGSSLLAIGGAGIGGCKEQALSKIYESRDGGITWKTNAIFSLPEGFDSSATAFAMAVDADNFIWIVCNNGQIWRGRLNRMGWKN